MMMFKVCSAFSLSLLALAVAMALVVFMKIHKDHTSKMCRGVAYLVVVLAFLTVICTGYYGTKYWLATCNCRANTMMQSHGKCNMNGKHWKQGQHMQNGQMQGNQHMMNVQQHPMSQKKK